MLKRGSIGWVIWNVVLAALFITFGILNFVHNDNLDYQAVIIMIIGILVVVDASIRLFVHVLTIINLGKERIYVDTRRHAIASSLELAVGISVINLASIIKDQAFGSVNFLFRFIGNFFGIAAIVLAGIVLIYGLVLAIKTKRKPIDIVMIILAAVILAVAGALILVYLRNENVLKAFFIFFGIIALVIGVALLCGTFLILAIARKKAKIIQSQIVEQTNEEQGQEQEQEKEQE